MASQVGWLHVRLIGALRVAAPIVYVWGTSMKIRTTLAAGVCAVAVLAAGSASAATISFTGQTGSAPSFTFSDAFTSVTATGLREDGSLCTAYREVNVTATSGGLGVGADSGRCFGGLDSGALDGQIDEILVLTLDIARLVTGLAFTAFDTNDPYEILVDDGSGSFASVGTGNQNPFAQNLFAKRIAISVTDNSAAFRVASMSYVVPLPAAGWMLLAGLGGLAALKRRRTTA